MTNTVSFFLNGRAVTLDQPPPDLLLIDYLRSPAVALAGPKKPCGQGGCGGCTVILSRWNGHRGRAEHEAINSCLRPVLALQGLVVTTVEGTGSVRRPNVYGPGPGGVAGRAAIPVDAPTSAAVLESQEERLEKLRQVRADVARSTGSAKPLAFMLRSEIAAHPSLHENDGMNPVAWRLAMNNGSQCGYCSVGFVMNMSEFLANHPLATKRDIEAAMDGNLCRCTGYRAILTGMKTFASDWSEQDEEERMKCLPDNDALFQRPAPHLTIPFPDAACRSASGIEVRSAGCLWLSPASLAEAAGLMQQHAAAKPRLVGANTGYGIYPQEYLRAKVRIDLRFVPELHAAPSLNAPEDGVRIPAGTTYSALIAFLDGVLRKRGEVETGPEGTPVPRHTTNLGALHYMARRTAGRIVRNAATVGGNTMLMLHHIAGGGGAPFPSDAATVLVAVGAVVEYLDTAAGAAAQPRQTPLEDLVAQVLAEPALAQRLLLLAYLVPCGGKGDVAYPQKVALREVNAHSIVNATARLGLDAQLRVGEARLVFGAIAPYPWRAAKTEAAMQGQVLSLANVGALALVLRDEVRAELGRWQARLAEEPSEGFTDEYRTQLCLSFLYKAVVHALTEGGGTVPPQVRSSGAIMFDRWAVSNGLQFYQPQDWKRPVAEPFIKHLAMEQASGQIHYTHELSVPPNTVNGSFVQSARALASWQFAVPVDGGAPRAADVNALRSHLSARFPAFVDLVTSADLKDGQVNLLGMGSDQPLFAEGDVQYVGQSLALVCADGQEQALAIAGYVGRDCVIYGAVTPQALPEAAPDAAAPDWWRRPVLTLDEAIAVGSIYPDYPTSAPFNSHIWKITRPGSRFGWADMARDPLDKRITDVAATVDGVPCRIVGNTQVAGAQIHFYMEPQAAIAEPVDARRMIVHPSTQSPLEMHDTVAKALANQFNRIEMQIAPVGGGFGGKTEQAKFVTGAAAVAAYAIKRPVRLAMAREQDSAMIGKRHAYYGQCQVAIDDGSRDPADKGILRGMVNRMWGDGGAFYDCSFIVANCIQARADNAYMIRHFQNQIDVCRTNTAPSTAFRAFGDIQGKLITENAIDDAAYAIGMRAEDVRRKNMYQPGDVTPFGQALNACYIAEVWDYLKIHAGYDAKVADTEAFNRANRWRKRGVAMVPVKYGSGYNLTMLEQAGATIAIYQGDGSIVIHQGGVEMGQGLVTQMRQIAAYVLNVPMDIIEVAAVNTSVVPNPSSTGGSTGTAYNGEAVKRLCQQMRTRLTAFADEMRTNNGEAWCQSNGIDYWNYVEKGWRSRIAFRGKQVMIWQNLVALAYQNRVGLVASFTAPIAGGETPASALAYKPIDQQPHIPGYRCDPGGTPGAFDNFVGFTYSAACAVAEIDVLTGEVKIISADLAYDMGWSLNQAVDIGQVEGAFVQGIGYVLSEKLVFEPRAAQGATQRTAEGTLNTLNTWTYKPPAVSSIPLQLNTHLFPRDLVSTPPSPTDGVLSSKEVGEPPLVLASSVFFAVKAAIRASRIERGLPGLFRFDAPATVQEVQRACALDPLHFSEQA